MQIMWQARFQPAPRHPTPYSRRSGHGKDSGSSSCTGTGKNVSSNLSMPVDNPTVLEACIASCSTSRRARNYYISWGNTTVSGGVIADVFYKRDRTASLHGQPATKHGLLRGLGVLNDPNNFTNGYDPHGTFSAKQQHIPLSGGRSGGISRKRKFNNQHLDVQHDVHVSTMRYLIVKTNQPPSPQSYNFWSVRNEAISTGTILQGQPLVLNKRHVPCHELQLQLPEYEW